MCDPIRNAAQRKGEICTSLTSGAGHRTELHFTMASEFRGCLTAIFGIAASGSSKDKSDGKPVAKVAFPYTRNERILSPAESSFLAALRLAVADEYEIFAKVRLLDVLSVKAGEGRQAAFNRVQAKHLDFLLCDRLTSQPVLALELDDSSHQRPERRVRDAFLEETLEVIGLPALRCPVTRAYDPRDLARLIKTTLGETPGP